jgi:hypothetical protein
VLADFDKIETVGHLSWTSLTKAGEQIMLPLGNKAVAYMPLMRIAGCGLGKAHRCSNTGRASVSAPSRSLFRITDDMMLLTVCNTLSRASFRLAAQLGTRSPSVIFLSNIPRCSDLAKLGAGEATTVTVLLQS